MKLSASQIKTFTSSKAKRAGEYILGLKEPRKDNEATVTGRLYERYILDGVEDFEIVTKAKEENEGLITEKIMEGYDILKSHYTEGKMKIGDTQVKVDGNIAGVDFIGYIDNLVDGTIWDLKTSTYLTKPEVESINFWSGMTTMEEYGLQLWIYMRLTGLNKANILEVAKHNYKKEGDYSQVIEFELTEQRDKEMENKRFPVIQEMKVLFEKYTVGKEQIKDT